MKVFNGRGSNIDAASYTYCCQILIFKGFGFYGATAIWDNRLPIGTYVTIRKLVFRMLLNICWSVWCSNSLIIAPLAQQSRHPQFSLCAGGWGYDPVTYCTYTLPSILWKTLLNLKHCPFAAKWLNTSRPLIWKTSVHLPSPYTMSPCRILTPLGLDVFIVQAATST